MDTLSNLLSSIKNGYLAKKTQILQPKTNQNMRILNLFIKEGFIRSYRITNQNTLHIFLKYHQNIPALTYIKRLSKPGKRLYIKNKNLYIKKKGFYIISTTLGLKTDFESKKLNLGGELICQIF